jgi:hypothetical protein
MKFSDNSFELSREDARLVGLRPFQIINWDELHDLRANTRVAYETEAARMWRCFDVSVGAGVPLDETMRNEEVNSFDVCKLDQMLLFIERVIDIQNKNI